MLLWMILLLFSRVDVVLLRMNMSTLWSLRTKSCQVVDAYNSLCVLVSTIWPVPAKTSVIPWTVLLFRARVNMKKGAFFVGAGIELGIEETFGHFGHIVNV